MIEITEFPEVIQWMRDVKTELNFYLDQANDQWMLPNNLNESRKWIRAELTPEDAQIRIKQLLKLSARMPYIPTPAKSERSYERDIIALNMHFKMAMWLCFFCIGSPQLALWREIISLSVALGAYPSESFFNKMVGDVYRSERNRLLRPESKLPIRSQEEMNQKIDFIFTMSFGPVVLIPDYCDIKTIEGAAKKEDWFQKKRSFQFEGKPKEDLLKVLNWFIQSSTRTEAVAEEFAEDFFADYNALQQYTDEVSYAYMRFQVWRYLRENQINGKAVNKNNQPYGILYGVSRTLASEALRTVRDRLAEARNVPINETGEREAILEEVMTLSDRRFMEFFGDWDNYRNNGDQRLIVFDEEPRSRRGITSSTLAPESGVMANRPQRHGLWHDNCDFLDGIALATEREKLKRMWESYNSCLERPSQLNSSEITQRVKGFEFGVQGLQGEHSIEATDDIDIQTQFAKRWYKKQVDLSADKASKPL